MTKADYLRDIAMHSATTCLDAAARLGMSEAAVSAALRRAGGQGLVRGDGGRPEKFTITDAGSERLRVLDAEAGRSNPQSDASSQSKLQEQFSALQDALTDVAEDVKVLFRFADKHLGIRNGQASDDADTVAGLLAEVEARDGDIKRLEEQLHDTRSSLEFYAIELALADLPVEFLQRHRDALQSDLNGDRVEQVRRLIEVQKQLAGKKLHWFRSHDEDAVAELTTELSGLREKLGFVGMTDSPSQAE